MPHPDAPALLRLAGAYVADGHAVTVHGEVRSFGLTDDQAELPRLAGLCDAVDLRTSTYENRNGTSAGRVDAYKRDATPTAQWLVANFGRRSGGKRVPSWLLGAPEELRRAFLEQYRMGDGHWDERKGRWQLSSASKELIIASRLLGQSLGCTCGYSWVDPKVTHIAGRELQATPQRSHRLTLTVSGRNATVEDGVAWQKIRRVEPAGKCDVFDLSIAEDNSYVVDGLISFTTGATGLR